MNVLELQLLAFGPFTDLNLKFPDVGLHVIYGPNEAGKSSALRALISLLYGIEHNTSDAFIHDYQKLRIGGRLRNSDGEELYFKRRKGRKDTLLASDGSTIEDSNLARFLHRVNRELFTTLFGIDHSALVIGGKDIMRGHGEVGQSLFAAGLGSANLRGLRDEIETEANALFLYGGKRIIHNEISKYAKTKSRIAQISLSSRVWSGHIKDLEKAKGRLNKVVKELQRLDGEKNRFSRIQAAIPNIGRRKGFLEKLDGIGEVAILGPDFSEERKDSVKKFESAQETLERARIGLKGLKEEVSKFTIPQQLLDQEKSIIELHKRGGAIAKAFQDLPKLEGELNQLEIESKALLSEVRPDLTLEKAFEARLSAAQRARIQELGGQNQALLDSLDKAKRKVERFENQLASAKEELRGLPQDRDSSEIRRTVERLRKQGDLEEMFRIELAEIKEADDQAHIDLQKIGLLSGTLEELEVLPIPSPETISSFESEVHEQESRLATVVERINDLTGSVADLDSQIKELRLSGKVPSEEELGSARARRDYGWKLIRREWLEKEDISEERKAFDAENDLPEAYEKSVGRADQVGDRLRREADRVAKQAKLISDRGKNALALKDLEEQKERIEVQLRKIQERWEALWAPAGITPLSPKAMRPWIAKQNDLVRQSEHLRQKRSAARQMDSQIENAKKELQGALERLGEPILGPGETLEALLDQCQTVIDSIEELSRERERLEERIEEFEDDLGEARQELKLTLDKSKTWHSQWTAAVNHIGLAGQALPQEAYTVLEKTGELFQKLDKASSHLGRIKGIKIDAEKFAKDVIALTKHVAPDLAKLPAEQAVEELHRRLGKAQTDLAVLKGLKDQITARNDEILKAEGTINLMEERLGNLCRQAQCSDYLELEAIEARSLERQKTIEAIETLNKQLLEQSAGATVEELIKDAEAEAADELPSKITDISEKIKELEGERDRLREKIWEERNIFSQMDGNEEAAMAAEEAQGILAEIRGHVERYIRLKTASIILKREIERYRAENQGPLLQLASELFADLTTGSFSGLQTDFNDKDEPILVGVRPSGETVRVEGMSDGTNDQLYLSLRLASLERYLEGNEPMPFVVDDILIKFDDERAEATLDVLAKLSAKTQVIFFTHHNHLVELAEKVDGDRVRIHRLMG
jgi:uncharacterized protein YhaN